MLIYSQPPRSAADAAAADRRATIAAYHKRTNPVPIADGCYGRWIFLVAGVLMLD